MRIWKVFKTHKVKVLPCIQTDEGTDKGNNEGSDEGMKSSIFQTINYYYYQLDNNKRGNTLFKMPRCNNLFCAKVILESCNFWKPGEEGAWDRLIHEKDFFD